ncbi:MAG: DUF4136 domain-containing protein [Acidobacteria bacterium]|nr:MAG: DUF4136 domain-containing protein [Acidobacteriota bacterium]
MSYRKSPAVLLPLLLIVVAAPLMAAVSVDYSKSVDFSQYKTYRWGEPTQKFDPELERKIHEAIDRELLAKGLTMVAGEADLTVMIRLSVRDEQREEMDIFGIPARWGDAGERAGQASDVMLEVEVGRLIVDLLDGASGLHLWRGTATRITSGKPGGSAKVIDRAARKMFKDFPPK